MIRVFSEHRALAEAAAAEIAEMARRAVAERGRFTVALAGGGTPPPIYRLLGEAASGGNDALGVPWERTDVFWGDERLVPHDHPDSNFRMARIELLSRVPVPESRIHPMVPADAGSNRLPSPEEAAARYEDLLRRVFDVAEGQPPPRFDLILLGLGEDGHTASLMPGCPVVEERSRWVGTCELERLDHPRVTFTLPLIDRARRVLFAVSGERKAEALRRVLEDGEQPASRVDPESGPPWWFVDQAAASTLGPDTVRSPARTGDDHPGQTTPEPPPAAGEEQRMNPLIELLDHGQSYWLDDLSRQMLRDGELAARVKEEGLRGVTSNPSIFDKAISGGSGLYDEQVEELVRRGLRVEEIYERLAVDDVRDACDALRPVYDESDGADGFVSLEVSPYLVHDTEGTIEEACRLYEAVDRPNVLIKIPGSPAGVPAIEECLVRGVNINVTLLFSNDAYEAVARAYVRALERRMENGDDVAGMASVASFFLSRIDVLVDELLGQRILPERTESEGTRPEQLLGRAAIANAKLAYQSFQEIFSGERWRALEEQGARVQRVLWASTSTKNPLYRDVRYVEPLIGPHTVNTMPEKTVAAFADHGVVEPETVLREVQESRRVMEQLDEVGIDFDAVTWQLLNEGMTKFVKPYDDLMRTLQEAREEVLGAAARDLEPTDADTAAPVKAGLGALDEQRFASRLHNRDTTLWTDDPAVAETIANRLGWLDAPDDFAAKAEEITAFADEVRDDGVDHVVVLGMGGSSLAPDVASAVFETIVDTGWPELLVLDSTDPQAVRRIEEQIDPAKTLFVVSSKSGTTTETLSFYRHFRKVVEEAGGEVGSGFVAITDPGSPLAEEGRSAGFRRVFENPEDVGGRYSALTWFGLVPMALMGVDVAELLDRARTQAASCAGSVPPDANPGIHLGTVLGLHARSGRDKVTFVLDDEIAPFGWWVEQLLAESTGKDGTGLIPVEGEPLAHPEEYGKDRLFVAIRIGDRDDDTAHALHDLEDAGHPVVRIDLDDRYDLGAEMVRWEVATATAGAILGVDPFDEPNVTESKENTKELLEGWKESGSFDEGDPAATASGEAGDMAAWTGGAVADVDGARPSEVLRNVLVTADEGDYLAILPYLARTPERHETLQRLRRAVRGRHGVATTLGYGPRYLHSSGQLHKGGPDSGIFLVLTAGGAGSGGAELGIPGEDYGFATLLRAQALGDFRSLAEHGRRVVRIDLGDHPDETLGHLVDAVG